MRVLRLLSDDSDEGSTSSGGSGDFGSKLWRSFGAGAYRHNNERSPLGNRAATAGMGDTAATGQCGSHDITRLLTEGQRAPLQTHVQVSIPVEELIQFSSSGTDSDIDPEEAHPLRPGDTVELARDRHDYAEPAGTSTLMGPSYTEVYGYSRSRATVPAIRPPGIRLETATEVDNCTEAQDPMLGRTRRRCHKSATIDQPFARNAIYF
jgi:hypothetical protein